MEHQSAGTEARAASGVGRSQNVLYVLPQTADAIARFLEPALGRCDPTADGLQLLVLTPDAEGAVAVAAGAMQTEVGPALRVLPVTSPRRAARLLSQRPAGVVSGTPELILDLIRSAALKLDALRAVVLAWADGILESGVSAAQALEAVMAEVPHDAPRIVVAGELTPAVEGLVERYARRPRRAVEEDPSTGVPVHIRALVVGERAREAALGRLLDELDPVRVALYARDEATAGALRGFLRVRGLLDSGAAVLSSGEPVDGADLVVLAGLPPSRDALRAIAGQLPTVALVAPRELRALRALVGIGAIIPYRPSEPALEARSRDERARDELRAVLADDAYGRELLALEPLLDEYDGAAVAAAALRLLERERAARAPTAAGAVAPAEGAATSVKLLFVNAGARDGVSARDLVGALANEAGVPVARIGRVAVQEGHSTVELDAALIEQAAGRLTGITLRGRRILARADRGAPAREPRGGGERGGRERGKERRAPHASRQTRGERPGRPSRGRSGEG